MKITIWQKIAYWCFVCLVYMICFPIALIWLVTSRKWYPVADIPGMLYYRSETGKWPE